MYHFLDTGNLLLEQKSLDALWLRQKVISDNLANMDTPGFKSSGVEFEDILSRALEYSTSSDQDVAKKVAGIEPRIVEDKSTQVREDGNNVDVDAQSIELVRALLQYESMARVVSDNIARMKYAVNGGK